MQKANNSFWYPSPKLLKRLDCVAAVDLPRYLSIPIAFQIVYPKFEFVLSSEIKNRNNLNKYFDETEVWYVLYNLVRAGNKFELLKQKIGDIHPNNILINEDGQTAIISRLSLPDQPDNFHRYIEDRKAEVFLGKFVSYNRSSRINEPVGYRQISLQLEIRQKSGGSVQYWVDRALCGHLRTLQ